MENMDKNKAIDIVFKKGKDLDLLPEEFKDDKDVVKTALKNDGEAMEFVSDRLKDDKELVLLAIEKAPWTACYA